VGTGGGPIENGMQAQMAMAGFGCGVQREKGGFNAGT